MNRRSFIAASVAAVAGSAVPVVAAPTYTTLAQPPVAGAMLYGKLVQRCRRGEYALASIFERGSDGLFRDTGRLVKVHGTALSAGKNKRAAFMFVEGQWEILSAEV